MLPPSERCSYECNKEATGPLNRKKLIEHINKQALETPDLPEVKPYVAGTVRGKKVRLNILSGLENNVNYLPKLFKYCNYFLIIDCILYILLRKC